MNKYYNTKMPFIIFSILLLSIGDRAIHATNSPRSASLIVQDSGAINNTLIWATSISALTIGGFLIAHKIKNHPLSMDLQKDENNSGWLSWIKVRSASLWAWLTNREKRVIKLSQPLIDRLDAGKPLADVMITKKAMYSSDRPEFFYGYSEVARRVINHASSDQIHARVKYIRPQGCYHFDPPNLPVLVFSPALYTSTLSLALHWGETGLARFLLDTKGADPSQEDTYEILNSAAVLDSRAFAQTGKSALHHAVACKDSRIVTQILSPHPKKQQILLDNVNELPADIASLILSFAEIPDVNRYRKKHTGYHRWEACTPLYIASKDGSCETLSALLKYKPNPMLPCWEIRDKKRIAKEIPLEALETQVRLAKKPTRDQEAKLAILRSYTASWSN